MCYITWKAQIAVIAYSLGRMDAVVLGSNCAQSFGDVCSFFLPLTVNIITATVALVYVWL